MLRSASGQHPSSSPSSWLPLLVLCVGLFCTCLGAWLLHRDAHERERLRFARLNENLVESLKSRFRDLALVVEHGRAFQDSFDVGPADWTRFYASVSSYAPRGLVGVGFIQIVPREELPRFQQSMSERHGRPFVVEAGGLGPLAYVTTLIEPMRENALALGKDLTTGNTRRSAAEESMLSGNLVLTRRINVVFREQTLPGFLAFSPVYQRGAAVDSAPQRKSAIRGWVYLSIQSAPLLQGLELVSEGQLNYEFYQGDTPQPEGLLFNSVTASPSSTSAGKSLAAQVGGSFSSEQKLDLLGRAWLLKVSSKPEFDRAGFDYISLFILVGGLLLSALTASLSWSLLNARDRAQATAEAMTLDLRRSEQRNRRLALIASSTDQGVVLGDMEQGTEWINEGFTRMTGYCLEDLLGRRVGDVLMGRGTNPELLQRMRSHMAERRGFNGEVLAYDKTGKELWLRVELQPLESDSHSGSSYMAMLSDITPRVIAEQQLRSAKDQADLANKAKSSFLAVMSHEIRTPLNGVIGMASVLADTELSSEQREFLEIIHDSGETLLKLINDILDFSKIESGHIEFERIPFSPQVLLGEVADLLSPRVAEKRIDLLLDIDDEVPAAVCSDPTRFKQIVVNLLSNAIKFTEYGEVELRLGASVLPTGRLRLNGSVRDTGVGISPEAQSRLFQSFSQADASTTRRFGGTGLGLAISRRLAEQMGGSISLESQIGHGSTFHFSIEVDSVEGGQALSSSSSQALLGKRLLIVDDNAAHRRILSTQALKWGLQPLSASCAVEALQRCSAQDHFDLALIDLEMPDMDGVALAREWVSLQGVSCPPLILMTGNRRPLTAEQAKLFVAVFHKPGKPGELQGLLEQHMSAPQPTPALAVVSGASGSSRHSERLLLVEDDPVNQRVSLYMLRHLGFEVSIASDGQEALDMCKAGRFDILVLDVQMPGVSGLEVASELCRRQATMKHKPWIIALTANVMAEDRQLCREAGMDDFVAKPVVESALMAALTRGREAIAAKQMPS